MSLEFVQICIEIVRVEWGRNCLGPHAYTVVPNSGEFSIIGASQQNDVTKNAPDGISAGAQLGKLTALFQTP